MALIRIKQNGASRLNGQHRSSQHGFVVVITLLLLVGTVAAQDTRKAQEDAAEALLREATQLVAKGTPASLNKAIEKLESGRPLIHSLNLPMGEGVVLSLLGSAYNQLQQPQKAIEKYEESLPYYRAAGEKKGEATALLQLGQINATLGEMDKALNQFKRAVSLFHEAGERDGETIALSMLGSLHVFLGQPDEAQNYYNQASRISGAPVTSERDASILAAIAPLYSVKDQPQRAKDSLEQAVSTYRALNFPRGEAIALLTLGLVYSFELDTDKALGYYERAVTLFRNVNDRYGEGAALQGVCLSYVRSRNYQKGYDSCAQALAVLRAIGDRQTEALTLKHIAIGEFDRGNLAASQAAIESAIANVESVRAKVVSPDFRVSFFAGSQGYYEFYINLLMFLHKRHPNDGYDGKALHAAERARARSLLDTLEEANADIRQGVDAGLLQRERDAQRQLNAKAQRQMQLLSQRHSEAQATAIAEDIENLIKDLQQVETEIRQKSPHYAALTQPQPLTLKEIQTQVLDPDTLLLEYSLGEEGSYVWMVTSSSITSYELPKRDEIETAARRFYDLLNARNVRVKDETEPRRAARVAQADGELPAAAAALSRMVLAPVASKLANKRLMIVADGALHFVPFGALPVLSGEASSTSRQRRVTRALIEDHEIVNLPSASTLAVIRDEVAARGRAPKSVMALADPVFMKDDVRVNRRRSNEAPASAGEVDNAATVREERMDDRQLVKATEDIGIASSGLYVSRLPGTRQEAEQIVAMIPPIERRLALDFAASRETATSAELSQYRYVHFSTHGFLNSVHPELSGLVLSLVNERGENQDGFLRAHEIFNLKLSPEMVVLSACQTGMGKNVRGEGLVSLTRGFMYAGAPRVVVSLWGVSDWGTTELMVRFYRGILKDGMRPAAALRAAQVSLMNDKRWASPYYWAPFTLQGEWR